MKTCTGGFTKVIALIVFVIIGGAFALILKPTVQQISESQLKTFDSKNYPRQFNFFKFQYPEGWDPYFISGDEMYIVKQDGPIKAVSSRADIESISNTYIHLKMSGDTYSEQVLGKYFPIKSAENKTFGDKKVLVWTIPASLEDAERNKVEEYSLNYTISTEYTNKKSITFMLEYKASTTPKTEDVAALETMIKTFTVVESPAPKRLGDTPSANAELSTVDAPKAIALSFEQYKSAILSRNGNLAVQYLDQRTINYYSKLRTLTLSADKELLQKESISDQISVLLMRNSYSKKQLEQAVSGAALLRLTINDGMIGENSVKSISVGTTTILDDHKTGYIQVKYIDGTISPLKIGVRLEEDGLWKIDLTSMFGAMEKGFQMELQKVGITQEEFVVERVSSVIGKTMPESLWNPLQ